MKLSKKSLIKIDSYDKDNKCFITSEKNKCIDFTHDTDVIILNDSDQKAAIGFICDLPYVTETGQVSCGIELLSDFIDWKNGNKVTSISWNLFSASEAELDEKKSKIKTELYSSNEDFKEIFAVREKINQFINIDTSKGIKLITAELNNLNSKSYLGDSFESITKTWQSNLFEKVSFMYEKIDVNTRKFQVINTMRKKLAEKILSDKKIDEEFVKKCFDELKEDTSRKNVTFLEIFLPFFYFVGEKYRIENCLNNVILRLRKDLKLEDYVNSYVGGFDWNQNIGTNTFWMALYNKSYGKDHKSPYQISFSLEEDGKLHYGLHKEGIKTDDDLVSDKFEYQSVLNKWKTHSDIIISDLKKDSENIELAVDVIEEETSSFDSELAKFITKSGNLILHGAPGTGKTFLAQKLAKECLGCSDEEIGFVQFHPSYDYTDFVEGLRPVEGNSKSEISFIRKDGVFKEFCKKAVINYNEYLKKPEELKDEDFFQKLYDSIVEDIQNQDITELDVVNRNNRTAVGIKNHRIGFGSDLRNESESNVKAMFLYLYNNKIDNTGWKNKDYSNLISQLTQGNVKVLDYTFYHAILCELIKRSKLDEYTKLKNADVKAVQKKNYVFIIDEINRGELSKIFGELFFNIDPGYRGYDRKGQPKGLVKTQYQNLIETDDVFANGFYIPDNVFIIGTMNDIDRNVDAMDFAFRRRFAFREIKAADTMDDILDSAKMSNEDINNAKERMMSLNAKISEIFHSASYHVGGAYFKKLETLDDEADIFIALWDYYLEGLLREYLRGMDDSEVLLEQLHKAYNLDNGDD